jgi:plasmid stability protein
MTREKKLKKAIRARARKTGESYTAARRQVLQAKQRGFAVPVPAGAACSRPAAP